MGKVGGTRQRAQVEIARPLRSTRVKGSFCASLAITRYLGPA